MRVLVTGGTGYIGSHTVLQLLQAGHSVEIVDNLSNSSSAVLHRIEKISGQKVRLHVADLLDENNIVRLLSSVAPDVIVHFAGLKSVSESSSHPLRYYQNNVIGTLNLLSAMHSTGVFRIVFSSSATVYGESDTGSYHSETASLSATNPYGRTKLHLEEILKDVSAADPRWSIAILRYFNPVGAHESGQLGEDPRGVPTNLMPYVSQVAVGRIEKVSVFGDDYPTPDGTGVRDYIHVEDLAAGHLAALDYIAGTSGVFTWNLGTGQGTSVLEVIHSFERVTDRRIPYVITGRRRGDIAVSVADPSSARLELDWKAERGLEQMVADAWRWQSLNPDGYESPSA